MGSPKSELERHSNENPSHEVKVRSFELGKYEVTFAEYDACVEAGGCPKLPDDAGWGRERRPVINVSWVGAQAYVWWLSGKTSKSYRLPSEAEWEYAARAGTTTRYWFGEEISEKDANYGGNVGKTTEVGGYRANHWGLHDMQGNAWEWVEDCWHDSYLGAPTDGSVWQRDGVCDLWVLRGGSWSREPKDLRAASRNRNGIGVQYVSPGFRVARTLDR